MNGRLTWVILACIMAAGVCLRLPALHWLAGAAADRDFSFHPDDERFVLAAQNIKAPNPDGYPQAMTTQLYVVHAAVNRFARVGYLELLHAINIFYSALSILLTYATARSWRLSRGVALLAAALLCVAPAAIVQANFGTADVTAMFYFYATLLAGGQYLRTRRQQWFVLLCVLTGFTVAVKFFIPLFAPLALVLATQRRGERLPQLLSALFIVAGSFEALSFFRYTPWDLRHLLYMLRDDNVVISGVRSDIVASGPLDQVGRYCWDLVSAVGIPTALLCLIGALRWSSSLRPIWQRWREAWLAGWRSLITPASLFAVTLTLQALLLVMSRIHAERHVLVFVPVLCIAAARTLFALAAAGRRTLALRTAVIAIVLGYQISDAVAVERLYATDVRGDLASWAVAQAQLGRRVITLAPFSAVRGTLYDQYQDPLALEPSAYVVTCDFEYARYLHHARALEVFHPMGGQARLDFFRGALESGDSPFGIVREFTSEPHGLLLRLVQVHALAPLGSFVPRHCFALGRNQQLPADTQRAIRAELTGARGW